MRRLSTRAGLTDLVFLIALLAGAWRLTHGVEAWMDLWPTDETGYLQQGVGASTVGLPPASEGGLYAGWYHILALFEPDPVELFYLSFRVLTALLVIAPYVVLRLHGALPFPAVLVPLLFLISPAPFVTPRPVHFAVVVLLLLTGLATLARTTEGAHAVIACGFLAASLARPEYFLGFLATVAVLLVSAFRRAQRNADARPFLAAAAVGVALIAATWTLGFPLSGERSAYAFQQHFALNYVAWTKSPLNPWTDADMITQSVFGAPVGFGGALLVQPGQVLRHVGSNLGGVLSSSLELALPAATGRRPLIDAVLRGLVGMILACALLWSSFLVATRRRLLRHLLEERAAANFALTAGLAVGITLLSSLLVFPRAHYLVGQALLLEGLVAVAVSHTMSPSSREGRAQGLSLRVLPAVLAIVLLVAAVPAADEAVRGHSLHQPNLKTVRFLRGLRVRRDVRILHDVGLIACYVGDRFTDGFVKPRDEDFNSFRSREEINMILVQQSFLSDTRFRGDPGWERLIADPRSEGFRRLDVPETRRYLLVQEGVLEERPAYRPGKPVASGYRSAASARRPRVSRRHADERRPTLLARTEEVARG